MKKLFTLTLLSIAGFSYAQFAPPAGEEGTTAIYKDSSVFINWASEIVAFERGLADIAIPDGDYASFGDSTNALGIAEGSSTNVVSLGDLGSITLRFPFAIKNGVGADFAVFENSFSNTYLEFAHVEVSTDGERFVRFPSISNIQTEDQTGGFGNSDAELVHNLAGKYRQGYGTPFDLEDIIDSTGIDVNEINYVRIIDVVGSIDPLFGTKDSEGNWINDPYTTNFESGGFDLDAIGVIHDKSALSINVEKEIVGLKIYPNPTKNNVFIDAPSTVKSVSIYDVYGQLVLKQYDTNQINLSDHLLPSVYIICIEELDGNRTVSKLILTE